MSFFDGIGSKVKGLLGDDAFMTRLRQAQAFLDGDYGRGEDLAMRGNALARRKKVGEDPNQDALQPDDPAAAALPQHAILMFPGGGVPIWGTGNGSRLAVGQQGPGGGRTWA